MGNLNCKGNLTIQITDDGMELGLELYDEEGNKIAEPESTADFASLSKELKLVSSALYHAREAASNLIHRTIETNQIANRMKEEGHSMSEIMEAVAKMSPEGAALLNTEDNTVYDTETGDTHELGSDDEDKPSILH